jgi:hypothetical protein
MRRAKICNLLPLQKVRTVHVFIETVRDHDVRDSLALFD